MNFLKQHISVRSGILGSLITIAVIFGAVSLLLPASSESSKLNNQTSDSSQLTTSNPESTDAKSETAADQQSQTTDSDAADDSPSSTQNKKNPTDNTTEQTQNHSTAVPKTTRTTVFTKGGFSQQGSVVSISSLASENLPAGNCSYTFENTDYQRVSYTNRSVERGCVANMPVSLFPYSSDTWYFDGASYIADDKSVSIPPKPQTSWPTVIIRAQDVKFTNVSISPMSDMTTVNAFINKKVPGTCTLRFTSVVNPSVVLSYSSPTIAPTEVTEYSNSGESMCGVALFHSSIATKGAYSYTITFRDHSGYIVTSTSGNLNIQ